MKALSIFILLTVFSFVYCTSESDMVDGSDQVAKTVTTEEFAELIRDNRDNPGFQIIDIRTPAEYNEVRLENAINIDYYSETFSDDLDELDKNKTYLVYCRSGNRGGMALSIFKELGFKTVYNMGGGIIKWISEDRPVVE